MVTLVFGGPSLEGIDLSGRTSLIFPPAAQGDLLRRVREIRPIAIGLLDGALPYRSFPVWHKEILFALNRGIAVVGAAGVGAHRAVELAPHGMEGVGSIHRRVASGALERDDEVLCDWESAPGGIKRLSLPLVSMRDALAAAREGGLLSERSAATLIGLAEELFWRRRTWEALLERARRAGVAEAELASFQRWLPLVPDPVKADAEALLSRLEELAAASPKESSGGSAADQWRESSPLFKSLDQRDRPVATKSGPVRQWSIGDLVSFAHPEAEDLNGRALNRKLALLLAALWGIVSQPQELEAEEKRLRRRFGLKSDEAFARWKAENDLDEEELARLLAEEALLHRLHRWFMQGRVHGKNTGAVLDELKLRGGYPEWKEKAGRREALLRKNESVLREEVERAGSISMLRLIRDHLRTEGFPWFGTMLLEALPETGLEAKDLLEEMMAARTARSILGRTMNVFAEGEEKQ